MIDYILMYKHMLDPHIIKDLANIVVDYLVTYENENMKINGKRQGVYKEYYQTTHRLYSMCNYLDDERHGEYVSWHGNRSVKVQCHYVHGQIYGAYRKWDPDGNIEIECYYVDNSKHGFSQKYDKGHLYRRDTYFHGQLEGKSIIFITDQVYKVRYFVNGELHGPSIKYINGVVCSKYMYKNGQLHGLFWKNDFNGKLIHSGSYNNGYIEILISN